MSAFLLFVLVESIRENEGPWFRNFVRVSNLTSCYIFQYLRTSDIYILSYLCLMVLRNFLHILQITTIVFSCEMLVDILKHSFIAKFNDIKPVAFSEYLEDLCKQVLLNVNGKFLVLLACCDLSMTWYFPISCS